MAYEIGYVDNTGTEGIAHWQMLLKIKTLAEANGWTTLRYLNPGPYTDSTVKRELILQGAGLSGTEQIFVGFRAYQNASSDYYNLSCASFKGYVAGNSFSTQPGASPLSGVPAHNNRIDYWLRVSPQTITLAMKVGTPVYEMCQVGKHFPLDSPGQYAQPLIAAGMLSGEAATRFSDTTHSFPWKGNRANLRMNFNDGVWKTPLAYPWSNAQLSGSSRDTGGNYHLTPIVLYDTVSGAFGYLDGLHHITGFNNSVENTLVIGGKTYVVIQDVFRTGFGDYVAMELS